jgi:hypothetical protein
MSKLRKSAKGQDCQIRIPGVCNFNPATTVLAHLPGGGMGYKNSDLSASFACSACHAWVDGGWTKDKREAAQLEADLYHHEGVIRTQQIWLESGLIEIK